MVIKVYISGISASKEVKKRQQRALFILDSLKVPYEAIDITEPGHQEDNERFRETCKRVGNDKIPLPPQFFNEDTYCGDWDDFFVASDEDTVLQFLKLAPAGTTGEVLEPEAEEEEEEGRKSVNGHVNGLKDDQEESESAEIGIVPNGAIPDSRNEDTDMDEEEAEGRESGPAALSPSPLPAVADSQAHEEEEEEEVVAAADEILSSQRVDEASKLDGDAGDDDGEDVEGNEVEE